MAASTCTSIERRLAFLLVTAGCGSTGQPLGFGNFCDSRPLSLCDVSQASCHQPLMDFLGCLAEWPGPSAVQVERVPELSATATAGRTLDGVYPALRLLELDTLAAPPEQALRANFEASSGRLLLSERAAPFDSRETIREFAAAAGRALAREHLDPAVLAREPSDYDAALSRDALIHGTGRIYSDMLLAGLDRRSYHDGYAPDAAAALEDLATLNAATAARPLLAARLAFGEIYGRAMLTETWLRGQTAAVRALLAAPPQSSAQVHEVATGRPASEYGAHVTLPAAAADALPGYTLSGEAVFGQTALWIALERWGQSLPSISREVVLRGDRLHAFGRGDGAVAAAWLLLLPSELAASDHASALRRHFMGRVGAAVLQDGPAVAVTVSSDPADQQSLEAMARAALSRARSL